MATSEKDDSPALQNEDIQDEFERQMLECIKNPPPPFGKRSPIPLETLLMHCHFYHLMHHHPRFFFQALIALEEHRKIKLVITFPYGEDKDPEWRYCLAND